MNRRCPLPVNFYERDAYVPQESLGWMMHRVLQSIIVQADKRFAEHDLTNAQWKPLFKLAKRSDKCATVAELARDLQIDAGAMTRLLDRLEKKGLVKRVRSTEDRRIVNIELTPEGDAAAAHVPGVLCDVLNGHLAGFSKTEWQALKTYLARMIENGEAMREEA